MGKLRLKEITVLLVLEVGLDSADYAHGNLLSGTTLSPIFAPFPQLILHPSCFLYKCAFLSRAGYLRPRGLGQAPCHCSVSLPFP